MHDAKLSVFALVNSREHAEMLIGQLKGAGFTDGDISALLPDQSTGRHFIHEHRTKAPEGTVAGASAGGALVAGLGWLVGAGALTIPGLGPLLAAGPLLLALSGAAIGAAVGGLVGALTGLGIPEFEARHYAGAVKGGNVLMAVHCVDGKVAEKAKEIFRLAGAHDICSAHEPEPSRHR